MSDDEIVAVRGTNQESGWTFELILFHGRLRGELRFTRHGAPPFTVPVDVDEIALFAARRYDLVADLVSYLIEQHERN